MPFGAGFFQAKQRAARYHFAAVAQKFAQNLFQIQQARLPIHQRNHVDAKGVLQLREFVELIQDDFGVFVAFEFNHDACAVFIGFVAQFGDAFNGFFAHQLANFFHQLGFVYLIRDFINDDGFALAAFADGLNMRFGANDHAPAPCLIACAHAC